MSLAFSKELIKELISLFWQAGTSTAGFDSNETNQADASDVITSRPRDKLKTYLHYQSAYCHQTWQDGNLPLWAPAHKVT